MGTRLESAGVKINKLGLGIEHFARGSRQPGISRDENSEMIIKEAFKRGITHYDLVFNLPYFFEVFKQFLKNKREKVTFTTHLGSYYDEKKNGHVKTRSLKKIQFTYEDMLERLDVDYADIALVQFVTHYEDYEKMVKNGVLDYAQKLKNEGKTKAVGLSAHKPDLLLKIIDKCDLDVIMLPINFATGVLPSTRKLLDVCKKAGIVVIAIKNLMKGKVFTTNKTNYSPYYCDGNKISLKLEKAATPADCINYALNLGVDSVVFGVKNVDELQANMDSFTAFKDTKNFTHFEEVFGEAISKC